MQTAKHCEKCTRKYQNEQDILRHTSGWQLLDGNKFSFSCVCGHKLVLRPKEVEWFEPDRLANEENRLLNKIAFVKKFPALSTSIVEISNLLRNEKSSAKEIALAAKKDPVVGAGILQMANNLRASTGVHITSLEHAVSYIGRETVMLIVLTAALSMLKIKTTKFRAKDFWREAFLTGAIAEQLVVEIAPHIPPDHAFIAGCLCNIGKIVAAIYTPQVVDKIFEQIQTKVAVTNWPESEKMQAAMDHCHLGEFAAARWGLPDFVRECIAKHHDFVELSEGEKTKITLPIVVAYANQLTHIIRKKEHRSDIYLLNSLTSILGFSEQFLNEIPEKFAYALKRSQTFSASFGLV